MDDRYELHKKLQDLTCRAAVSINNLKAMHLVSYTTMYDFLKDPSSARSRTLSSVRLVVEFLECACRARLLPVRRVTLEEVGKTKEYYVSELYERWWDNDKKFTGVLTILGVPGVEPQYMPTGIPSDVPEVLKPKPVVQETEDNLESDIENIMNEVKQDNE